jgi:hypothetical protein
MKKIAFLLTVVTLLFVMPLTGIGQVPPPPDQHGSTGDQNPGTQGGAPIAGGAGMLLAMGAAYAGKRIYDYRKNQKEEGEA